MGIQINGTTDNISANDGSWTATGLTGLTVTGIVTATSFSGDGASLTNVSGVGVGASIFTSPGTFTIGTNCPSTITNIKITCCGGGGSGAPAGGTAPTKASGGASLVFYRYITVSNGQSYSVTVGGAGGTSSVVLPTASPTTIVSVSGGSPGPAGSAGAPIAPVTPLIGSGGLFGGFNYGYGLSADADIVGNGAPEATSGGGGSTPLGRGGTLLPNNSGRGGDGYGSGGSGGGGGGGTGGTGAPGVVIFEW